MGEGVIALLAVARAADPRVIGIVADHPFAPIDALVPELVEVNRPYFDVRVPADKVIVGDWNRATIRSGLDQLLADPEVDLVIALGVLASDDAIHRAAIPKPLVAPFVLDPVLQRAPSKGGASGVRNLTYVAWPNPTDRDLRTFHELAPFDHVAVLVHERYLEVLGGFPQVAASRELGFAVTPVPVPSNPLAVLGALPGDVDAVYVTILPGVTEPVVAKLADGLTERGLPTFSMTGQAEVALGVLAGLSSSDTVGQILRSTAVAVQDVLLGAEPGQMPIRRISGAERLSLNLRTAERLGLSPRWETLYEAELYEGGAEAPPPLSLSDAVVEALDANLGLQSLRHGLDAADADRRRAVAAFLPQVTAEAGAEVNDGQRADASFGTIPRSQLAVGVGVRQLVFADAAVANLGIQSDLDRARDAELEVSTADLAHRSALAWVDVQRARSLVELRVADVRRVQTHLEVARSRRSIGEIAEAEVARFEAEVSEARRRMVEARGRSDQAGMVLNQLRGRAADEPFVPEAFDPSRSLGGIGATELGRLIDTPARFELVEAHLAELAAASAPELARIDALLAAQERDLGVARRATFLPTVGVEGTVGRALYRDADVPPIDLGVPGVPPVTFPERPDGLWSVGASVSLPLFAGGERDADRAEAGESLASLRGRREEAARQVDLRVRTSLVAVQASAASAELATRTRAAAARSLEYAEQAYGRGLVGQVALLEARNASLDAELALTDANYLLLADLLAVERAVVRQHARMAPEDWAAFVAELVAVADGGR